MSEKNNEEKNKNPANLNDTNEDGEILTLSDLLNEQREIDEDALAVLGGSDENHCTYSEGYIKRQALYACLTCLPESKDKPEKRAGVCLACSYRCHDGHDLIELYTKRNFRCDCGTSKILAIRCKLDANKMDDNDKNTYNQNFSGVYCVCHRPYPDEQDDIQDEMIQCVFCEDWFHSRHLNAIVPEPNAFDEMICDSCTLKNDFLNYYSGYCITSNADDINTTINTSDELNVTDNDVANKSTATEKGSAETEKKDIEKKDASLNAEINQCIQDIIEINKNNVQSENSTSSTNKRSSNTNDDTPPNKKFKIDEEAASSSSDVCQKPTVALSKFAGASFWPIEWRTKICKCSQCLQMYKKNDVEFLLDDEDTVHAYQEKGKAKAENRNTSIQDIQEETMRAISGLDHVAQIETVMAYNKLKKKLTEFLAPFVQSEQVVTEKDVATFFQTMGKKG
ncbi:putative E3 ubiquitin-protein ligase UBR7 [Contarinia nasturtii]|uniref:putative E3 ubiquitin-protein ligase UBR7 n=1 Tax=Contarinia nasturtii TaxID=265458 RepID=UPI0012D3BDB1|nr:putative E3 ubiquitin-protein ligase UBR7 [Contarinia nasturtii]